MQNKYKEETAKPCPNTILSRKGTIISYLIAFERLFRTKQTKKEPACSVVEQAGVPRGRVFGLSIDRKGLFYLLTLESIGLVSTENVNLIIINNLFYRVGCIYIIDSLALNEQCRIFCITGDNYCSRIILNAI